MIQIYVKKRRNCRHVYHVWLLGVTFQINPIPRQAAEGELIELATHGSVMYSVLPLPRGYPRTPMEAESCSEVSHGAGSVSVSFSPRPPMTCCFGKNHGFIASVRFKGGRSLNPTGQSNSGCPKTLGIGFDPSPSTLEASLSLSCCPGLKSICKWEMSIAKLYYWRKPKMLPAEFTVNQDVFVLKVWGFVLGAGSDSNMCLEFVDLCRHCCSSLIISLLEVIGAKCTIWCTNVDLDKCTWKQ